ncbi:bifunctional diaminohydroxyphosphoribosylaminopyrimidine deaminase/5-amino-6-(5-phosphoribosylamino)uracil reductase RibD [uncultured Sphingomonas sp.]|uniref:bifunctional diaminohydroxyphosphoribosylaminopyrimidine deaminase/5-amino-6-(5-phosphoribosylamino)uracil reductase RibD n=1 Tax=uncultured Sphingomonas sp. TaxID=158754 RepID=UPI0035CA77B1
MGAALTLGERGRGRTAPNPNVGCVIVRDGRVVGRGWTQIGGRPHAEAMALEQAGAESRGATCYTTLEPCAHRSVRGPTCSDSLVEAGVARVVAALGDPDPRTDGGGFARLRAAEVAVAVGIRAEDAQRSMAGFLTRRTHGRPHVTLKLATSLDGRIATASGESRWITGPASRAHAHLERARHETILVGRGTWEADAPTLDVRLAGLEGRSPRRILLTRHPRAGGGPSPAGSAMHDGSEVGPRLRGDDGRRWEVIASPHAVADLPGGDHLLVEGGAATAAAFLAADLVDRLLLYRAPIVIGGGLSAIGDIGLPDLAAAHGRWRLHDARGLGGDRLEVYERRRS